MSDYIPIIGVAALVDDDPDLASATHRGICGVCERPVSYGFELHARLSARAVAIVWCVDCTEETMRLSGRL